MDETQLQAYFNSSPAFQQEYARNKAASNGTDTRSPAEWMRGFLSENPQEMAGFNSFITGQNNTQAQSALTKYPDLASAFQTARQSNPNLSEAEFLVQWANANPNDPRLDDPNFLAATGLQDSSQQVPLEQGLLTTALPGLISDLNQDPARKQLADQLAQEARGATQQAVTALSPEANAARLAAELAQADQTGQRISESAATSASDQLRSLQQSIASMQQNLTGDLAAKAAALQQQIATLNANLDTLDASQKATLATQIAANQKNLEDSIAAQRQSLGDQITALRGAADAQSQARMAALQKEIDGLTAAQAPLAQARLDSANALATSINQGLQSTQDQLTASRAKQGYLGTSSFDDAAQARAAIAARQQAAQALGGARELNASDLATIGVRGATEGRTIADELAANQAAITGQEATGGKSLADMLAQGTQSIRDTGAAGEAGIAGQTAQGKFNVGNAGATQQFQDQVFGADKQRELADLLAGNTGTIGTTLAQQQQQARDAATQARQAYFDNAYTRGLAGTLAIPGLDSSLAGTLTSLDNYGQSGLARTQGLLNWWQTAPTNAPTSNYVAAQADNSGNQISALGANLVGSAGKIAAANNWWQDPGVGSGGTYKGIPVANTPATASGANWWKT